ncbi:MAG: RNA-binding S4 domain-containing protein [Rikenellaceae bacterium]
MQELEFKINGEYIELIKLLKATNIASSGGEAKILVESEVVLRNGEIETRKRAKITAGETIEVDGAVVVVTI